jgi:hypothetical protein
MRLLVSTLLLVCCCASVSLGAEQDVRVLATAKTSTMENEMNEAAEAGFRFAAVMGGDTAFGGSEVVVIMTRTPGQPRVQYRLLATGKTSTLEKELQQAGDAGFEYRGQTVFKSTFGGKEVAAILERDKSIEPIRHRYRVLATSKTSTMEKELRESTAAGYEFVGMTVGKTLVGGEEVVCILRKKAE